MAACSQGGMEHDATGVFEATEVIVSAEQAGRLMSFDVDEGDSLAAGQQVGLIDTVQLQLRAIRLGVTKEVYASQRPDVAKQIAVTKQQIAKAEQELKRYDALVRDNAANRKQLDDAESNLRVLRRQLEAQVSQLGNTTGSLNRQMDAAEIEGSGRICHARQAVVQDRRRKRHDAACIRHCAAAYFTENRAAGKSVCRPWRRWLT